MMVSRYLCFCLVGTLNDCEYLCFCLVGNLDDVDWRVPRYVLPCSYLGTLDNGE